MNAAIVTIGDEILIGQISDTNSVWIAQQLTDMGIQIAEMISISDNDRHIRDTLDKLVGKIDLVLLTGGLGPTKDDITKHTLCDYFEGKLIVNQSILTKIEEYFKSRGRSMIESNRLQAQVPDNCRILENNFGTAPGMWFVKNNSQVISMPGVPYEMKPMVIDQLIPALNKLNALPVIVHKTIMTEGVPESYLAALINRWETGLPTCIKLAYLPRPGIVRLRLSVTGECAEKAEDLLEEQIALLKEKIGDHIFSYEDVLFEKVIANLLLSKGLTVSSAESCTGGNIARLLTSVAGSSKYYKGSIIAYSNEVKENMLNVPAELIGKHGAVSKEVAEAMAIGAIHSLGTDLSIAVSGIAGPDGGTEEKPVGTVWIAIAFKEKVYSQNYNFGGHRDLVIEQASIKALSLLRKVVLEILE